MAKLTEAEKQAKENHERLIDELLTGNVALSAREVAAKNEILALREDGKASNLSSRSGKRGDKDADEGAN